MGKITKQDLYDVMDDKDYSFDLFIGLMSKHLEIQIPEELSAPDKKDELVDYVYKNIPEEKKEDGEGDSGTVAEEKPVTPVPSIDVHSGGANKGSSHGEKPAIKISLGVSKRENDTLSGDSSMVQESSPPKQDDSTTEEAVQSGSDNHPEDITPPQPPQESSGQKQFKDRKSHIIWLCKQSEYKQSDVVQVIDDSWGYSAKGKTSKTRVAKTIRDLRDVSLITIDGSSIILWIGEK